MLNRAVLIAGKRPPRSPSKHASATAVTVTERVTVNEYTSCESHNAPPSVLIVVPLKAA